MPSFTPTYDQLAVSGVALATVWGWHTLTNTHYNARNDDGTTTVNVPVVGVQTLASDTTKTENRSGLRTAADSILRCAVPVVTGTAVWLGSMWGFTRVLTHFR